VLDDNDFIICDIGGGELCLDYFVNYTLTGDG
jgi:hypothetical protein